MQDTINFSKIQKKDRIPTHIKIKAVTQMASGYSMHYIHRTTGLSKPYITKLREHYKPYMKDIKELLLQKLSISSYIGY